MSDEAEVTMLMYAGLKSDEARKLKSVDGDVAKTLIDSGINKRAVWDSLSDTECGRSILLCVSGESEPQTLLELSEDEVSNLTATEIVSRVRDSLE